MSEVTLSPKAGKLIMTTLEKLRELQAALGRLEETAKRCQEQTRGPVD